MLPGELGSFETQAGIDSGLTAPGEEVADKTFRICLPVDPSFGQDVPNDDEEFAGDGDNGFATTDAIGEAFKRFIPGGVKANGNPSSFDEGVTKFLAALFGDPAGAIALPGSVNPGAEAGIADQFFGGGEAGDIADGTEDDQAGHHADAGKLDQVGQLFTPGVGEAEAMEFIRGFVDEGIELFKHNQLLSHSELVTGRQVQFSPPITVIGMVGFALRW